MIRVSSKARSPYDRYDRCDRWEKQSSAIAAIIGTVIIWKPPSSDRSDNDRWDRKSSFSGIVVVYARPFMTCLYFIFARTHVKITRKWKSIYPNSWFSRDVTKIQTKKLSLLLRFYFHVILEHLKTFIQKNFQFKMVLCFSIQDAWISRLLHDAAFSWRPGKLLCGLKTLRTFGDFAI